jgi:hypothetical protein
MDLATDTLTFTVKASIVESIIGDLFFRDHEVMNDFESDSDDDVVGRSQEGRPNDQAEEERDEIVRKE